MNSTCFRSCAAAAALMLAFSASMADQSQTMAASGVSAATFPGDGAVKPSAKTFSQQDLDQLLAPIALYSDDLLAQMLMASTYPLEVVQAARWVKANPKVTGKALEDAMAKQSWDPAVKSLTAVPQVLQQMNDRLDWMQKLGDAFLAQQKDVMATVQALRAKAAAAGNLKPTDQQQVKTETVDGQTIYTVESTKTQIVYVPVYNPYYAYGPWWYPPAYPPYYMYPPTYVYPPHVAFTAGIFVGVAIWGGVNWHHGGGVYVNVNHYNSFNRTNINNGSWNHNVNHRGGVAYADKNVASQYNRGGNAQTTQSRNDYRGRADSGSTNRPVSRDSAQPSARDGAGTRNSSGGGFSGVGNGASTREASQRGSASRTNYGGGGGGYRGGGGGGRGGGGGGRGGGGGGRGGGGGGRR